MSAHTRSGIKNPMCLSLISIHQTRILRISPIFPKKKTLGILRSVQCAVNFRPCIDIHKGKVKQIVGSTLQDTAENSSLITNFESNKSPAEFADLYKQDGLLGGHVIMLGADDASKSAAMGALHAYPGGMQAGGGINSENAIHYLEQGASHVIVTSYVFRDGKVNLERLKHLVDIVGKHKLVLDLSCRKMGKKYVIVTDRWQKFSNLVMDEESLAFLATYADEFLVHGVEVEGKRLGIDEELVILLGRFSPIPVTYAGGVTTMADLEKIKTAGRGRVDVSIGSALDIFGGELAYEKVVAWHHEQIKNIPGSFGGLVPHPGLGSGSGIPGIGFGLPSIGGLPSVGTVPSFGGTTVPSFGGTTVPSFGGFPGLPGGGYGGHPGNVGQP